MMRVRKRDRRPGAATVEFAFLLPFLLYVCVIAVDWARLLYYTITIDACARNGALYASDAEVRMKSPYLSVREAALAEAPQLAQKGAGSVGGFNGVNIDATVNVVAVDTTDSSGNPAVKVTVSMPFRTYTNLPGVPSLNMLTRSVQMRKGELAIRAP